MADKPSGLLNTDRKSETRRCVDCGTEIHVRPYRLRLNPNYGKRCGRCNGNKLGWKWTNSIPRETPLSNQPLVVGHCEICGFYGREEFAPETMCPKCGMVYLEPFERNLIGSRV